MIDIKSLLYQCEWIDVPKNGYNSLPTEVRWVLGIELAALTVAVLYYY